MLERGRFPTALACSRVTRQVGAHLASRQPLPPPTQQEGEAASGQGPGASRADRRPCCSARGFLL